ncbi:MAG TPA: hypothetical protein VIV66_12800 [Pyrinomonadaceae bacterium]
MKRCPKCNRTFPDENQKFCTFDGGLLIGQPSFDPNVTIRATAADVDLQTDQPPQTAPPLSPEAIDRGHASTSRDLPDFEETILASAPTAVFPRNTSQSGNPTSAELSQPPPPVPPGMGSQPPMPLAPPASRPMPKAPRAPDQKKSKLLWIIGIVLLLLILGTGAIAAAIFMVFRPRVQQVSQPQVETETPSPKPIAQPSAAETKSPEATKTEADTFVPPADATKFQNAKDSLDGKLAEHYVAFSFYYPSSWKSDPKAGVAGASNFARVFKTISEGGEEYTPESVAVSWYNSNGTYESDVSIFPERVEALSAQLAKSLPNYRKVSEGPTQVNALKSYDFHFSGVSKEADQDLPYWGRAIFVPPGVDGSKNGVTIIMLVTARGKDVKGEEDVGVKGDTPLILESFRFERKD